MTPEVHEVPDRSRYEAWVGGELSGRVEYERADGVITLTHTVVEERHEGQGVGGALVRTALDDARAQDLVVVPRCPFVAAWIERHPDYADLVLDR